MEIKIISDLNEFDKIEEEYSQLCKLNPTCTPFMTHHWMRAWWNAFKDTNTVKIFNIYKNSILIASMPIVYKKEYYKKIKVQKVKFIGAGWGLIDCAVNCSESIVYREFSEWLFGEEKHNWDMAHFYPMPISYRLFEFVTFLKREYKRKIKILKRDNPYLLISENWEQFLKGKSKNFRRTLKRKEKTINNDKDYNIEFIKNPNIKEISKSVFDISQISWQGKKNISIASSHEGREFYRNIIKNQLGFDVYLTKICYRTKSVGYLIGFERNSVYHAFDTGYNPDYDNVSPGLLLHYTTLKYLHDTKIYEFNFGYGHSYKERFAPLIKNAYEIMIFNNKILWLMDKGHQMAKKLKS